VDGVVKMTAIVDSITKASENQFSKIQEAHQSLGVVEKVAQQNTQMALTNATTSENLSEQASALTNVVSKFKFQ